MEEKLYKEECEEEIKHVCEEHIQVPSPPPPPAPIFPEPYFGPGFRQKRESNSDPEADGEPDPEIRFRINLDNLRGESPEKQRQFLEALLKQESERTAQTQHQVSERQINPSVLGGTLLSRSIPSQVDKPSSLSNRDRLFRSGRGPTFLNLNSETANSDTQESLEEKVQKAMLQILTEDKKLSASFNKLFQSSDTQTIDPGLVQFPEADTQHALPVLGGSLVSTPPPPPDPSPSVPPPPPLVSSPAVPPPPPPVPTVTIKELPAEPGCRSFSTLTCVQVPVGKWAVTSLL